ncbi:glutamine ABC transporter substrate-binding protein, partial [Streptococcus mutans]|nr:glutamine ABC transporter substrate-binding protein [Streptococcus mutans]
TQEYGIATKKSNTGLTKYVNYLLKKWTADKSLESIYNKHNLESAKPDK